MTSYMMHDLWRKHKNFVKRMGILKLVLLAVFCVGIVMHVSTDVPVRS